MNVSNRAKGAISHTGEACVFKDGIMNDVLFVPNFKLNLLLVSKMTR